MAKRFAYVSFGVLCLVAAYQLGAERARAEWDTGTSGQVVGGTMNIWFNASGEAWNIDPWMRLPSRDLPVLASQVMFLDGDGSGAIYLITTDDVAWSFNGQSWVELGPFPGGPVALPSESWGGGKGKYR